MYFSVGASEILLDDTLVAAEKAYKEGVDVEVEIKPFMCHVYPVFVNIFPKALYCVVRPSEFLNKYFNNIRNCTENEFCFIVLLRQNVSPCVDDGLMGLLRKMS